MSLVRNIFKQQNMFYSISKEQLNFELDKWDIWHDSKEGMNSWMCSFINFYTLSDTDRQYASGIIGDLAQDPHPF